MNFPTALGAVLNGCKATRLAWGDNRKYIWLRTDLHKPRIRYETPFKLDEDKRLDWSYYPMQDDMLATDWELVT